MKRFIIAGLLALSLATAADAQSPDANLTVAHAWARATPSATANAAVYLTVTAKATPDTLTGASTPVAARAQLHESKTENGIMRMRPVDNLPIDKDHPITLAPGGYHLMLTGMKQQLKLGETFPLTLTFAHAGAVQATVTVEQAGVMPAMGGMGMGGMGH
jgi:copper(I)-binding protein